MITVDETFSKQWRVTKLMVFVIYFLSYLEIKPVYLRIVVIRNNLLSSFFYETCSQIYKRFSSCKVGEIIFNREMRDEL